MTAAAIAVSSMPMPEASVEVVKRGDQQQRRDARAQAGDGIGDDRDRGRS